MELRGVHDGDTLKLTDHERDELKVLSPEDVFPEYFVIRVNQFDKPVIDNYLEEWMDYLKYERISPETTAPGLQEARERLDVLMMSDVERRSYEHYIDTLVRDTDVLQTQLLEARIEGHKKGRAEGREEGLAEGRAEGREEGRKEERASVAMKMKELGLSIDVIVNTTGLSLDEVEALLRATGVSGV